MCNKTRSVALLQVWERLSWCLVLRGRREKRVSKDLSKLRRHLEALTAERCPAEAIQEEESAGLRAAWLAFGKLLEDSQAEADISSALPEARQGIPAAGDIWLAAVKGVDSRPLPIARSLRRRKWLLAATAAAAASVLLALAAGWYVQRMKRAAGPSPEQIAVKVSPQLPGPTNRPAGALTTASRAADWTWDDSVDQAIDLLGWAAIQVEQDELASTAGSSSILNEFEAIRNGVNNSSDFPDVTSLTRH
jgi:hypothetical protein